MKIGTDGVLLGAWTSLENHPQTILDIGTGTGIIGLQLAQRSSADMIDAVEIDDEAYEQCVENFENSPWNDRLFCYHAGFDEFVEEPDGLYDLIVTNPPFHQENNFSGNLARDRARFSSALPFEELVRGVQKLLAQSGIFSLILPKTSEAGFIKTALRHDLHLQRKTEVKGNPTAPVKRSLLQFGFEQKKVRTNVLIIEKSRHKFTEEYIELTKDFYLKM